MWIKYAPASKNGQDWRANKLRRKTRKVSLKKHKYDVVKDLKGIAFRSIVYVLTLKTT